MIKRLLSFALIVLLACTPVQAQFFPFPGPGKAATGGGGGGFTFNSADQSGASFSAGDLTITGSSLGTDGGSRSTTSHSTGKYHFRITGSGSAGSDTGVGISDASSTFANLGNNATTGAVLYKSGNLWVTGSNALTGATAAWSLPQDVYIAVDLTNKLIWASLDNSTWSNSGNPAAGTGGISISGITCPCFALGTLNLSASDVLTINPGATPPSGFSTW